MSSHKKVSSSNSAIIAVLFLIPPLVLFLMWISTAWGDGFVSDSERKNLFLDKFPEWMQNFSAIHVLALVLCVVAINFASGSFKKKELGRRIAMMVTVMLSIFLILFNLAQLFS